MDFVVSVYSDSGRQYDLTRGRDGLSWACECPAWRNKRGRDADHRVCKHILALRDSLDEHVRKVDLQETLG